MLHAAYSSQGFPNNGAPSNEWYLDRGASSHVTGNSGNLDLLNSPLNRKFSSIVVGNGIHIPITSTRSTTLSPYNFHLHDVIFSPHIVTNLMSVR